MTERTIYDILDEMAELQRELRARVLELPQEVQQFDLVAACESWVRGVGWDESFTEELVDEQFGRFARHGNAELEALERTSLLELWRATRAERYPEAA